MKSTPSPPAEPLSIPATQVLRQFRMVFNAVKTHFQQMEEKAGIGGAQVWALSIVAQQPGVGMGALGQAMDIHQSTTSNLVKTLVQRELLRTERDDRDRRAVRLFITPAGRRILRQTPAPWSSVLHEALGHMDESSLRRLEKDLGALIKLLGKDANARAARTPLADM